MTPRRGYTEDCRTASRRLSAPALAAVMLLAASAAPAFGDLAGDVSGGLGSGGSVSDRGSGGAVDKAADATGAAADAAGDAVTSGAVGVTGTSDQDLARDAVESGKARPLAVITRRLEQRFDAQLVDVKIEKAQGRLVYRMKLLTERGRVFVIRVEAETGNPL